MIIHVDLDAYYASIEERDRPELKGQPVIVGGSPDHRGVVCAANYVARRYGVHSAMSSSTAHRLCPHGVFLPCRMDYYAEVSRQIREIFENFTPLVEPLSLDEAFLDVSGSTGLFGSVESIGRQIKAAIRKELDLVASVGVAPNKFLAKIASDLEKPDGFVVVDPARVQEFLDPLPVERLWGVGRKTGQVMQQLRIATIGALRQQPVVRLKQQFGSQGEHFGRLAHGIDERKVVPDREAKSISHETTFGVDIGDPEVLRAWLLELTEQVARRLRGHELKGGTVKLKIRFADFRTITRSQKLPEPTNSTNLLWQTAGQLLARGLTSKRLPVRLLGMGVADIDQSSLTQKQLFDQTEHQRQSDIDKMADLIKGRFGKDALRRGSVLEHGAEHRPLPRPKDDMV